MNKVMKIIIVLALIVGIGIVVAVKQPAKNSISGSPAADNSAPPVIAESIPQNQDKPAIKESSAALPRLLDLGADKCIPCKMMMPVLEELKKEYSGKLDVVFIDVWKNPDEGNKYGIHLIPTQIFFDASGKELFRHEGFFSKEDILSKWKELGIAFDSTQRITNNEG